MTKSIRNMLLGALALTLIVPAVGMAQTSATDTATASATILAPITIAWAADLDFGDIVADATTAGTVTVAPDGTASSTTVQLLAGTTQAASFTVGGQSGRIFYVTPIGTIALGGAGTMFADIDVDCGTCTVGTDGVAVGGTLYVGAAQAAGAYSTTFDVTVSYQ